MQAWLIDDFTGIEHLRLADVPDPAPAAGEVVLDLCFAALNPADRYLAQGQYPARPPLPHVLGRDGMGVVSAIGDGVAGINIRDRFAILRGENGVTRWGSFAQRVAAPAESLVPAPDGWSEEEAACATLVYLTAYQALTQWEDLPPEAVVLVSGASGGVGVASVQLAAAMGHTLIGLSRDEQKAARIRSLGASATFNPHDPDWPKKLKQHLQGRRVDLAIDNIGGSLLPALIDTLGQNGRVSLVGQLAGPVPQFSPATLFFRRLRLGGVSVGSYTNAQSHAAWSAVLDLLNQTNARPLVDQVFPFNALPAAFARLSQGPMGKVLLKVS